jgi:D-alanine--poly(phosphoribitol) ligase subunit 1
MKYDFNRQCFQESGYEAEKAAVIGSDRTVSWKELAGQVEHLAQLFRELAIPKGHPVMIYGHKESAFPVAMLACYHADITYIPIDIVYPIERIRTIAEATGSQVLICTGESKPDVGFSVVIDRDFQSTIHQTPVFPEVETDHSADLLQYIIFTSGSTGEPKGVQITKSSIQTFVDWAAVDFGFSGNDVLMNQAPFSFDVSLCDILNAFVRGGTLVLSSGDQVKDQDGFLKRLAETGCSVWTSTPSFLYLFLRHENFHAGNLPAINTFLFMGEELPNRTCGLLKQLFPEARILNAYGPTEATIVTTLIEITDAIIRDYPLLPIGYAMPGSSLLIDKTDTETNEGELIIVGNHVSIGYYKRPELNDQKFFLHNGQRAFRTGDLAYYEGDLLFCLGRNDDQVKLHGYRIELNEISHVLCKHALVSDAVSIALKRGNEVKKIISFVIPANESEHPTREQLSDFLAEQLPYYMVPGDVALVEDFPYNSNHKIDKNQLTERYVKRQFINA